MAAVQPEPWLWDLINNNNNNHSHGTQNFQSSVCISAYEKNKRDRARAKIVFKKFRGEEIRLKILIRIFWLSIFPKLIFRFTPATVKVCKDFLVLTT
jgi:hypothetical protein